MSGTRRIGWPGLSLRSPGASRDRGFEDSAPATRYLWFAGIVAVLLHGSAYAQDDRPSHVPVPRATDADPTKLFRDRIEQSKSRTDLDALLKRFGAGGAFGNAEQMRRLLEENPQLRDMARQMARDMATRDPQTPEP